MLKHILVPVDFSSASDAAVRLAAELAHGCGAEIDLLHVWDLPAPIAPHEIYVGPTFSKAALDAIQQQSQTQLERVASDARAKGAAVRQVTSLPASAYEVIVEEAERHKYDLIVVGTHSRKRLARFFIGSVAERVMRYAPCSVLVARQPEPCAPTTVE